MIDVLRVDLLMSALQFIEKTGGSMVEMSIRSWDGSAAELSALVDLHTASYREQFFAPQSHMGGALAREFPALEIYQNRSFFARSWARLAERFNDASRADPAYIYVAEINRAGRKQMAGLLKGSGWQADAETLDVIGPRAGEGARVASLGSLYIDSACQGMGMGRILTSFFAKEALKRGFNAMTTHAYDKNTSPAFFVKQTGAELVGACPIPNHYDADLLAASGLSGVSMPPSIPGVVLYWDKAAVTKLAAG